MMNFEFLQLIRGFHWKILFNDSFYMDVWKPILQIIVILSKSKLDD